jgi:hypothetical protein
MIVVLMAYAGACVYGNWIVKPEGAVSLPPTDKAAYVLTVRNTGTVILAAKVQQVGSEIPGGRIFKLPDGYWEKAKGGKFKYIHLTDFRLDEAIWGEITVTRRLE